ncbi:MAG: glycosyltransferase family 2 protein [Bacilli bacterium]|nr:glycosyltransferase family 2 protein [Bacilli bacterium]
MTNDKLVSIIIPVYNASRFLEETINSIQKQTYSNWEAIFIDDCSSDNSYDIIKQYQKNDKRIKVIKNKINNGVAISRNNGIDYAKGEYLCFLDADDKWHPEKLAKQINFMQKLNCEFSFTGYQFANEKCTPNGKIVLVPNKINYKQALKNTTIWTSTVMFDMGKLTKDDIYMPNIKRGQDTATWWKVLKKIEYAYGLNEVLSYYRRTNNSLSANKLTALKRTWNLYRNVEHLNILSSFYNFCWYCFNAVRRRV